MFNFEITATYLQIRKLAVSLCLGSVILDVIFKILPKSMNLNLSQIYDKFVKKINPRKQN